jgi:hypothetical protein
VTPGFRRVLQRLTSSRGELHAQELREATRESGATPVSDCRDRARLTVSGSLRTVTLQPRAGVPALEAELFDGSGTVTLVWLGRRQILGIEPGRRLDATGLVTRGPGGEWVMFNPRYTLHPRGSE